METPQQTSKEYFRITSVIHMGLVLGVVIFGLVVSFFIADFQHPDMDSESARIFVYLVPGICILALFAAKLIFGNRLKSLMELDDLKTKMTGYRECLIIRYLFLEGPALFAMVAVFLTGNIIYLIYAGVVLVLFILKRPTLKATVKDLALNQEEVAKLEDPDAIVA
jgi:MFS family permease